MRDGRESLVPEAARIRLISLFAAAVAVSAALFTGWGSPVFYALPLLTVSVLAAELAAVHLSFGKQRWTFSVTEAAIAAAYFHSPRAWTVVGAAAGVFLAQVVRRQQPGKLVLAVTQYAAATSVGAEFANTFDRGLWGVVGGMAVFWLVNNGLAVTAVAATTGQQLRSLVWARIPFSALHSVGAVGLGILGAWLASNAPLGLFALVIPLVLLWISYDEQATRAAETALFAELARLQERASSRSVDGSAQVILTAASRLFASPEVEMLLLAHEGPVHYAGNADGISRRRRVDPEALDEPWVLKALAECGTLTGVEDEAPWCVMVLGDNESPLAAIRVRRQVGSSAFGRRDVLLAGVLADQAESWLSIADRAEAERSSSVEGATSDEASQVLAGRGAGTEPSLQVLRDASTRLSRLAAVSGAPAVGDIVDELYAIERAVASLLGAVALAADPDLGQAAMDADLKMSGSRRFDDWTTTGVLT